MNLTQNKNGKYTLPHKKEDSLKVVRQALSFERPDRLPVFDASYWSEWEHIWRKTKLLPDTIAAEDYYGTDLKVPVANETLFPSKSRLISKESDSNIMDDGWGRIVRTKPGTYFCETVDRYFKKNTDIDKLIFESAELDSRYNDLVKEVDCLKRKGRAVFVKIGGVFIRSSFFRGETEFLMDLALDEPLAKAIIERVSNHLLNIGLESLKRTNTYDTGVWVYDDMCSLHGPMFSPNTFEKIFLPVYKKLICEFKRAGARWVILHCDGNLMPLLDMVVDAGFDGINPVERSAGLCVEDLIKEYYGKLSFIGGVCNTHIMPHSTHEEIKRHVEAIIDAGRNGGVIIGTHSIGPDIPVENYELYRSIVAQNGFYKNSHAKLK
jgi:hypothetical protein